MCISYPVAEAFLNRVFEALKTFFCSFSSNNHAFIGFVFLWNTKQAALSFLTSGGCQCTISRLCPGRTLSEVVSVCASRLKQKKRVFANRPEVNNLVAEEYYEPHSATWSRILFITIWCKTRLRRGVKFRRESRSRRDDKSPTEE